MQTAEKKSPFVFTFSINPGNTAETGNEQVAKSLHLVYFGRKIVEAEYVELLRVERMQPCKKGRKYLSCLMTQLPISKMPTKLRNKDIVTAELDKPWSIGDLNNDRGSRRFLYTNLARRQLDLLVVDREWSKDWVFLTEDMVP